jgi:hypothetical protein
MRYVNLVPERTPKPKLTGNDKYQQYLLSNIEYRNRPERKEFMKEYYAEYRKEHDGLVQCDCGSVVKGTSMYNHVKSNKHIDYIQNASS